MKISYEWLRDLVEIDLSAEELGEKLTLIGLELDGMHFVEGEPVLDIETSSNRGDCLSHLGVAREIAVATRKELRIPESPLSTDELNEGLVTIQDPDICHRFTARIIRNVKIGPSPEWLKKRIRAVGERPINNVADITNYAMHTLGQPMHAFDLSRLDGGRIIVRRAKNGEGIVTLDEVERKLDSSMLVICDSEKPAAIGGVMGGLDSGITESTVDVLLEVACFHPDSIRRTSRDLGLTTEASYRFERGVDVENLVRASNFAAELIAELAGGDIGEFADVYPFKPEKTKIEAPDLLSEVKRLSGLEADKEETDRILSALGISRRNGAVFVPPTWRHDLEIEEDLVEELVRFLGYEKIGEELPPAGASGEYLPSEQRKRRLRNSLATIGFDEAISYSFIANGHDGTFGTVPELLEELPARGLVEIRDPVIEGSTRMRPTLLPGLLDSVKTNFNHRIRDVKLFEVGKVFVSVDSEDGLPAERELLALALTGSETFEGNASAGRRLDFYDLKGALELAFESIRIDAPEFRPAETPHLQAGQSAEVLHSGSPVGFIGKLRDEIGERYKFRQPVFVAEIDLQGLVSGPETPPAYTSLPVFPSVFRDVSMAVKRDVTFAGIRDAILAQGFELCRRTEFVDVFEGRGLPDDERAVTIRIEYRSNERTLTEEEVDAVHSSILEGLRSEIEFERR